MCFQFLRATAGTAKRVLAIVILSLCLSVRLSVTIRYRFKLSEGTNIDDLERPRTPKIGVLSDFFLLF